MRKKTKATIAARLSRVHDRRHAGRTDPDVPAAKKDGRAARRVKTYKIGLIRFNRLHDVKCVVFDLTDAGARVTLSADEFLPPVVTLEIRLAGVRRRARVIWQKERDAGLEFEN